MKSSVRLSVSASAWILGWIAVSRCHGFVMVPTMFAAVSPVTSTQTTTALRLGWDNEQHDDNSEEALSRARNDARVDVRNLLTQRAIQSFLFLCETLRDPHSGKWIEEFLGTSNQLEYHGTGAAYMERFGGTWDAPLLAMMERPKDVVVVSAKRSGKGHKGWSKNNPYLEDRYVEFYIDIDPVSLTSRILSVREQIAREWETDLDILGRANQEILNSYHSISKQERAKTDAELQSSPPVAFERTAALAINDQSSFSAQASSPFRKGNFDLLCNLCTQASVHRLLRQLKQQQQTGGIEEPSFAWLRTFYVDRLADYFDGNQKYGRADDFLEELLLTPPFVIKASNGKSGGLVDPMGLTENIIEIRSEIINEWKTFMAEVPQDHGSSIRKALLEKQMAAWGSGGAPLGGGDASAGSFE